ncbi:MAG TPA: phosphatidylglycerol lysyltransferase domain-containing protein, partial [Acidimicrobiales bacterium]|nr:phosphatidylglycerol lysyltransferase domain-containing protein [Acidimicrobiales bacterium]
AISVGLLATTLVLHLARGADVGAWVLSALATAYLVINRAEFTAESDRPSLRSAVVALVLGVAAITVATSIIVEVSVHFDRHRTSGLPWWRAGQAVVERLVGVQTVPLPRRVNEFLAPSLLAIGIGLAVLSLVLATRPVVDRRRGSGRLAELRARDIVERHGSGTLDYFALRADKRWFFHRDSLVAYAIYGGACLVSPDPIGPRAEREQVWASFRRFADGQGWTVAITGTGEEWLPTYRATGMHEIYIGDEAVVDVQRFSLAGGQMKGLRQAFNRVAKYGYTASFHDPSRLDPETATSLSGLMSQSRRGEFERGFSMMLGRIFDPRDHGLMLCVVTAPNGQPAAMCQFVPAKGIDGFSLDLMRRDRGEHPNGLIDFALVSTIEHVKEMGKRGLSLNFAALRSILEGERGDGVTQRVERWAVRRMSSFFQIETLWRFNAKYQPDWLPRYVVYDTAEHLVPVVLGLVRAESLWEVPVIGRVIAASDRRSRASEKANGHGTPNEPHATTGTGADLLPDQKSSFERSVDR